MYITRIQNATMMQSEINTNRGASLSYYPMWAMFDFLGMQLSPTREPYITVMIRDIYIPQDWQFGL